MGFAPILDMHSPIERSLGWNKMQYAVDSVGTRQSSFRAYLPQSVAQERSSNLHICTGAVVTKVDLSRQTSGKLRAESVEVHSTSGKDPVRIIKARREVILTCGALRTPQLLMLR